MPYARGILTYRPRAKAAMGRSVSCQVSRACHECCSSFTISFVQGHNLVQIESCMTWAALAPLSLS
eukprot:7112442-Prorocentrum_lima.AAC.1